MGVQEKRKMGGEERRRLKEMGDQEKRKKMGREERR